MEDIYPPGPLTVPESLRQPTRAYKLHAWLAVSGLALFVISYCLLTYWFIRIAFRLFWRLLDGAGGIWDIGIGAGALFLAVFMIKSIFFINRAGNRPGVEVTPSTQPRLFEFLYRLADEAGAPRPHRVFLSPEVNASVFYDLSVLNLVYPSRKNLEIGLGLVNVLTLGELKAVLAHEFGHFAQRTMAVGRWVYVAQQIVVQVVARRDALDEFLASLSRFDLRFAWIGWVLSLIIWAIRSLVDTAFGLVLLSQRVLSREMEMQADLVSVSLTGSEALICALHRLQGADQAWEGTKKFALAKYEQGREIGDAFAIQTALIEHLRNAYDDPSFAGLPRSQDSPEVKPEDRRIFRAEIAHPPQMWSTHPLNHEREENAKRLFVAAPIDQRSAWELFDDITPLRATVTRWLFDGIEVKTPPTPLPIEEVRQEFDRQFSAISNRREYAGIYMGRSIVISAEMATDLYSSSLEGAESALDQLDPQPVIEMLERRRNLSSEKVMLEHLHRGTMTAPNGVIRYRGGELKKSMLPAAISEIEAEIGQLNRSINDYDRLCRTVHRAIAVRLGQGWDQYLTSLVSLLHYADHTRANLQDAIIFLQTTLRIESIGGRVSGGGFERILYAARETFRALQPVFAQREQVVLNDQLAGQLQTESWSALIGEFGLPEPNAENFSEWIQVIDSWSYAVNVNLLGLSRALLDQLLEAEGRIASWYRLGEPAETAPVPLGAPIYYSTLTPGSERQPETKIGWWTRFQNAVGVGPAIARFATALLIVGGVTYGGSMLGEKGRTLTIYNGLGQTVEVSVNGHLHRVDPTSVVEVELPTVSSVRINTETARGERIESFDAPLADAGGQYVYNVASASPIVQWTLFYSQDVNSVGRSEPEMLGAARWFDSNADFLFRDPPKTLSIGRYESPRRLFLKGYGDSEPLEMVSMLSDPAARTALILSRARWEAVDSNTLPTWLSLLPSTTEADDLIATRLRADPEDIATRRAEQDRAVGAARVALCEQSFKRARELPLNPGRQYLAIRCLEKKDQSARAFENAYRQSPSHLWLAYAASQTFIEEQRWDEAGMALESAVTAGAVLNHAVVDLARVRSLLAVDGKLDLEDLTYRSAYMQYVLGRRYSEEMKRGVDPYLSLELGRLEDVLANLPTDPEREARLLRLVAASDGASREMVARALALPPALGLDQFTVIPALALAISNRVDHQPYTDYLAEMEPGPDRRWGRLIDTFAKGGSPASVEALLQGSRLPNRPLAYLLGVLILREKAPAEWRNLARRMLFRVERPFLK